MSVRIPPWYEEQLQSTPANMMDQLTQAALELCVTPERLPPFPYAPIAQTEQYTGKHTQTCFGRCTSYGRVESAQQYEKPFCSMRIESQEAPSYVSGLINIHHHSQRSITKSRNDDSTGLFTLADVRPSIGEGECVSWVASEGVFCLLTTPQRFLIRHASLSRWRHRLYSSPLRP